MALTCPFCGLLEATNPCPSCNRNPAQARRLCISCSEFTPVNENRCCHCNTRQKNGLRWKIPLIALMFLSAITVSILVQMYR